MITHSVIVRSLGLQNYLDCWQAMRQFTDQRTPETMDEIWTLQHHPVYTLGQNGKREHILNAQDIPIIHTDRGGQITYHGPGQLVIYPLIDLKRKKINIRQMVTLLEQSVVTLLSHYEIQAFAKKEAPGVYIKESKIASVGLRVRRGCTYHGLAMNIAMDLAPFSGINPCGFSNLQMTQLQEHIQEDLEIVSQKLTSILITNLGYTTPLIKTEPTHGIKIEA